MIVNDCGCLHLGSVLPLRIPCAEHARGYGQALQALTDHSPRNWHRPADGTLLVCTACSTPARGLRWPCRRAAPALAFMREWQSWMEERVVGFGDEAVEGTATQASAGGARPGQRPAQQGPGVDQEAAAARAGTEPGPAATERPQPNNPGPEVQVDVPTLLAAGRAAGEQASNWIARVLGRPSHAAQSLTAAEHEALRLSAELANALSEVVGDGPNRAGDLDELVGSVHQIQRAVLAQAAGRAYPDLYRLLGQLAPGSS